LTFCWWDKSCSF